MIITANGNNLQFGGDTRRRVATIRHESKDEYPELRRGFAIGDLAAHASKHHPELLADVLTVARAWMLDGQKTFVPQKQGSFAEWSHFAASIPQWLGVGNPLATFRRGGEDDSTSRYLLGLLDWLWRNGFHADTGKGITAAELESKYEQARSEMRTMGETVDLGLLETLNGLLGDANSAVSAHKIAQKLRDLRGRTVNGQRLDAKVGHGGGMRYSVFDPIFA